MNASKHGAGLSLAAALLAGCGSNDDVPSALGTHRAALVLGSARWERRTETAPPARMGHALIQDSARGVTLAVGGRPPSDTGASLSDTWAWDGVAWSELAASFPSRGYIQGVFDSTRQLSVVYGGVNQNPSGTYSADTLERGAEAWSSRSGTPAARANHGLAFDAARGVAILFGGFDGTWRSDLWEWNGDTWTQRCTSAPCDTAAPSRRAGMVLTYDAARQETLLFGGYDSTGSDVHLGDTWTWNGTAWTQHTTPIAPSARVSAAAAYDPVTRVVYVFGGADGSNELGDLWAWDGSEWQQIAAEGMAEGAPSARRDARLAWDGARRRGVLFGGRSDEEAVDFWELSLVGNECTSAGACHTGVCEETVCVDDVPAVSDAGSGGASGGAAGSGGAPSTGGTTSSESGAGGALGTAGDGAAGALADAGVEPDPALTPEPAPHSNKSMYACAMRVGASSLRDPKNAAFALSLLAASAWLRRRRVR